MYVYIYINYLCVCVCVNSLGDIFSPWFQQSSWVVISTPFTFWRMSPIRMPAWHRLSNRKKFGAITNKWQKDRPKPAKNHKTAHNYDEPGDMFFPPCWIKTQTSEISNDESLSAHRVDSSTQLNVPRPFRLENLRKSPWRAAHPNKPPWDISALGDPCDGRKNLVIHANSLCHKSEEATRRQHASTSDCVPSVPAVSGVESS